MSPTWRCCRHHLSHQYRCNQCTLFFKADWVRIIFKLFFGLRIVKQEIKMYFSGAFSEVKLAEHRETKKLVAIKCIPVRITISFYSCNFLILSAFASQCMFSHFDGDCCPLTFGYFRTFDLRVKLYFDWWD